MSGAPLRVAVIIASTREGRLGGTVAEWFAGLARRREALEIDVVDLAGAGLPARLPEAHPREGAPAGAVRAFAGRIGRADGFVVVTPEYNHGYPGSLKDAMDLVGAEWRAKPIAFVSYGGVAGGVRAVEQLRQVAVELHLVPVRDAVMLPMARRAFRDGGAPADPEGMIADGVEAMLDRLEWWSRALAAARRAEPYD